MGLGDGPVLTPVMTPIRGRRGGQMSHVSHASPMRVGADQRIAERIAARLSDAYGLSNVLAAPLRVDGRTEGAIVVSRRTSEAWPASARRILEAAAVEASAALARVYSLREAEARATTDALTGLPNRRYFDEYLTLLARRRRAEDRVGVLMVDIDRFKKLNDTFGHAVGDHVLREVARAIGDAVREDDVPARFGGEEFAVLLRNPSPEVAVEVGERVRRAVAALDLRRLGVPGVSVSVGVAVALSPEDDLDVVIDEADRALYRAKRAGRDRVVAA
jgi:diguanylate cyclase